MAADSPAPSPAGPRRAPARRLRRLDRRTVGICALIALIAALASALLVSTLSSDDGRSDAAGQPDRVSLSPSGELDIAKALRTELVTFAGRKTSLSSRVGHGRPVVVNFFSSTCPPCVTEMPAFERVHRARDDVSFVGIDVQDRTGPGRKLIERTGITYEALQDPPGDLLKAVGGVGLPTTLLFDGRGRLVASHTGALSEQALRNLILRKLK